MEFWIAEASGGGKKGGKKKGGSFQTVSALFRVLFHFYLIIESNNNDHLPSVL